MYIITLCVRGITVHGLCKCENLLKCPGVYMCTMCKRKDTCFTENDGSSLVLLCLHIYVPVHAWNIAPKVSCPVNG